MLEEVWKDVVGFEGLYQVSSHGRFKSLDFTREYIDGRVYHYKSKILKTCIDPRGYICLHFYNIENGRKTVSGHRVVAEAFIPNPENKKTVNHKDGNRTNNKLENLEWNTYSENNIHAMKVLGKKTPSKLDSKLMKLDKDAIVDILKNCKSRVKGSMLKDFAKKYNVSSPCIAKCLERFTLEEFNL